MVSRIAMNVDWAPLKNAINPVWQQMKVLFQEHHFLTIVCGFFALMMIISFYKFLRSISPALVGLFLLIIVAILFLHWIQTRTEPSFMKPFVDSVAPFFPTVPQPTVPPPKA